MLHMFVSGTVPFRDHVFRIQLLFVRRYNPHSPVFRDRHNIRINLQLMLFIKSHALIQILIPLQQLKTQLYSIHGDRLRGHQASAPFHIIINGFLDRAETIPITNKSQIKQEILAPVQGRVAGEAVFFHHTSAVQLIPHDSVVVIRRIISHLQRKLFPPHYMRRTDMFFFRVVGAVDPVKIRDHQITVVFFRSLYQTAGGIRRQTVIAVHELKVFSFRQPHAPIPGIRYACIFLVDNPDTAVSLFIFPADLQASVPASIIQDQNFHVCKILLQHTVQTAPQIAGGVVNRYNQCHQRHLVNHSYVCFSAMPNAHIITPFHMMGKRIFFCYNKTKSQP